MQQLIEVNGKYPRIDPSAWIAPNAIISGDTTIGKECSIWFGVVIRGDVNRIIIGDHVNIQDLSMVHGTYGRGDTIIGDHVSIGHRAIIHGCQIEDHVLVGMGAIILDDVKVPSNCIIAAGSVVTSGTILESGFIYAGVPAKKLKPIDPEQSQIYIEGTSKAYVKYKEWYR
ncbi:MAG: gamma carbonic anhydrase family protein [Saprospiraceae bacterium]|nr:gamma carbonic anhydrase family protein [Saprospiraceae bacterium]